MRVRHAFFEPIGAPETIARRPVKLVDALCDALEQRGLGAVGWTSCASGWTVAAKACGSERPSRTAIPSRLARLLADRLDTINPGFGIEAMSLSAPLAEPLQPHPSVSSLAGEEPAVDVEGLVDVLVNRLGRTKIYRMAPVQSDVPERSIRRVAASAPPTGRSWPARWPRPSRLLSPAKRVEALAMLPDQPPVAFTWRGQRRRVGRADGPERIYGEWWKRDAEMDAVRDYFAAGGRRRRALLALPPR